MVDDNHLETQADACAYVKPNDIRKDRTGSLADLVCLVDLRILVGVFLRP